MEKGILPLNTSLQDRAHKLQARRQDILTEMAGYKRQQAMPLSNLTPKQVSAFSDAMRSRLHDRGSNFGKEYLRLFVNRIKLTGHQVEINGSYGALAQGIAQMKTGALGRVPVFVPDWLPGTGSNRRPSD